MKRLLLAAALSVAANGYAAAPAVPDYITAAVADPGRPAEDSKRDADRKPAEMLAFAGIKAGDTVVDFIPGKGYFTRIFSKVVGAKGKANGKVYALEPTEIDKEVPDELGALKALAAQYPNVTVLDQPVFPFKVPEAVDLVWTSQNYHDLHDPFMGSPDVAKLDKQIYDALKPGGIFLVLDHAAAPGTGLANTNDLHRIDPETVKKEVTAAGFEFVGSSEVLRNPADPHTIKVFDPSIRGRTRPVHLQVPQAAEINRGSQSPLPWGEGLGEGWAEAAITNPPPHTSPTPGAVSPGPAASPTRSRRWGCGCARCGRWRPPPRRAARR